MAKRKGTKGQTMIYETTTQKTKDWTSRIPLRTCVTAPLFLKLRSLLYTSSSKLYRITTWNGFLYKQNVNKL